MSDSVDSVNTETSISSNVLSLKDKKPRKNKTTGGSGDEDKKKKKPTKAELFEAIYNSWMNTPVGLLPKPAWNIRAHSILQTDSVKALYEIGNDNVCSKISKEKLAEYLLAYVRVTLASNPEFQFIASTARECADYINMAIPYGEEPAPVRFKDDPGLCWHRLPFKLERGLTPNFDDLFGRMTNSRAVKAWIWSLFVPESYNHQYVWLHGQGNDGKSSLFSFLHYVMGEGNTIVQEAAPGVDKHWAVPFVNKRLVYFPDFSSVDSLDRGPLKMLTGGDYISVRPFFGPAYSVKLQCKAIFGSNNMPHLTTQKSNQRRIIFAELTSTDKVDVTFIEKLKAEGGAFLHECKTIYEAMCPNHERILSSEDSIEEMENWGRLAEEPFERWFKDNVQTHSSYICTSNELGKNLEDYFKGNQATVRKCYGWLKTNGYKSSLKKLEGAVVRVYLGIRIRKFPLSITNGQEFHNS